MPKSGSGDARMAMTEAEYHELRAVAQRYFRHERPGHTLQPTALVHEAYLRVARRPGQWRDRSEFLAVAGREMRRVLVDHARRRGAAKRGAGLVRVALDESVVSSEDAEVGLLDLAEAVTELGRLDPCAAHVVDLRLFGGLTIGEVARELDVSERTVEEDWRMARAWLSLRLGDT